MEGWWVVDVEMVHCVQLVEKDKDQLIHDINSIHPGHQSMALRQFGCVLAIPTSGNMSS